jgi:hypothetical protein
MIEKRVPRTEYGDMENPEIGMLERSYSTEELADELIAAIRDGRVTIRTNVSFMPVQ